MSINYRYIRFFREVGIADIPLVGGKNASLGEMYRELTPKGVRVPNGFAIPFEVEQTDLQQLARPLTRIMINLGNPELAFKTSFLPNDGVGLARMEFIVSEPVLNQTGYECHRPWASPNRRRVAQRPLLAHSLRRGNLLRTGSAA